MVKGRSFSRIRTPILVRRYLSGEPFPDGHDGQDAIDPAQGDFIASIHRHLKARIRQDDEFYHWPRNHSFVALIRHLQKLAVVEPTGVTETSPLTVLYEDPPEGASHGDLRLDTDRGFQQRHYYRLTPGAEADPARDPPMGTLRIIYGIQAPIAPVGPRPQAPRAPGRARPRRPGALGKRRLRFLKAL